MLLGGVIIYGDICGFQPVIGIEESFIMHKQSQIDLPTVIRKAGLP